ncbi:gluconate 2-dehydrogenase [Thioclava dalianensis]|uniref:Gluconate 2-dehydrogenase n=1 Tax=Thioclava dalianensis TaxID=1185766 RepID=A0A074TCT6_9RHOB|nr:gluconate 2-dehydrogenase subunit 3 family protein [Thioclava dalianensis]KEP67980.1 gluconate 2-dehydrogenase [Thioclava dalianensis]SFN91422.1 gluconate 2-dehydrogenase gamma chain [Thioclava dalianensis]
MSDLPGRPSRRGFLKGSAAGAALAAVAVSAQAQTKEELPPLEQYKPSYFTPEEFAFIMAACDRLIPADGDGPGALETRVPVFIDRQLEGDFGKAADWYMEGPFQPDADPLLGYQSPLTPAQVYRAAIPVFEQWCQDQHGKGFADLDAQTQDAALSALEKGNVPLKPELRDFFAFILQNTKEGYFADPMYGGNHGMKAWTYVGFPGARGAYTEWVSRFNETYPLSAVDIAGERA